MKKHKTCAAGRKCRICAASRQHSAKKRLPADDKEQRAAFDPSRRLP